MRRFGSVPLKAILLFPPNWSASVSGPHLALPLLAGMARGLPEWEVETWDLSERFYRTNAVPPLRSAVVAASHNGDLDILDRLYFDWEDQLRSLAVAGDGPPFGLLSGYSFGRFRSLPLSVVKRLVCGGTVYTPFLTEHVVPCLVSAQPSIIGITIASQEQLVPVIELLQLVREALPEAFLLLGGNVVTRLRETSAFGVLTSLADQTAVFQGDLAFRRALEAVGHMGVQGARDKLPRVVSDESVPYELWPVPVFDGIPFEKLVGTPVLSFVSTRGCYWGKCHFCAIPAGWSTRGYGGSAPADFVAAQLVQMATETGIPRVKLVDEAVPPSKVRPLSRQLRKCGMGIEWEGYARLERAWEDTALLDEARAGGLRKLYFGLEQAPSTSRVLFGKNDQGDPLRILRACHQAGIKVHLFCMVGHPGTSRADADATVDFLVENAPLVDTADLVGFRLDRGTNVPGVRAVPFNGSDWTMSLRYEPTQAGVLSFEEVDELEAKCQEQLWDTVPRLLHPLYRIVGPWDSVSPSWEAYRSPKAGRTWSASFSSML